jgi:hypothetical protein
LQRVKSKFFNKIRKIISGPIKEIYAILLMTIAYISSFVILVINSKNFYEEIYNFYSLFYINLILMIFMLYNYNICYFSDPGILPKNLNRKPINPINTEIINNEKVNKNIDIEKNINLKVEEKNNSSSSASLNPSKNKMKK